METVVLLLLVVVVVVVESVEPVEKICPGEPSNMLFFSAVEVTHAPPSVCAKEDANRNIKPMSVTLDTSHLEISPLNEYALKNMELMSVTLDTSQFPSGPCWSSKQSPDMGDFSRHASRALLNSALDFGGGRGCRAESKC